ncbi:MAG: hypothetical protein OEV91_06955 [Desulfobulbaceae bacterium]|nr:hypothetical protein [Desulfobulbaceae bacterium]
MLIHSESIAEYRSMFTAADRELCIFTGKGDLEYAADFVAAAGTFLARPGRHLRVACQCGDDISTCPIIQSIANDPQRQGELSVHDAHIFCGAPYFILSDGAHYRLEITALDETITDHGDPEAAARLHEYYQQILSHSPCVLRLPAKTMDH